MKAGIEHKIKVARELQAKINAMQGLGKTCNESAKTGFAPFANAFPRGIFPIGAIHEFVSYEPTAAASTTGFIVALTGKLMNEGCVCLWIGNKKKIFPVGLKHFGLEPDRIVFINTSTQKDRLWIIEEALKCEGLIAVIGEIKELTFTESRRLQLAVEHSGVTAFIHRHEPYTENAVASTARWKITPLPSISHDSLPGIGYSCWDVQLLKVKNGKPNAWTVSWFNGSFQTQTGSRPSELQPERHTG